MFPPCEPIILAHIGRPSPVPDDLYVIIGLKISSICSGEIPHPVSVTAMITLLFSSVIDTVMTPDDSTADIASIAFLIMLIRACFSLVESASIIIEFDEALKTKVML